MPSLEVATATFALPVWVAAAAVGLFIIIGVMSLTRAGAKVSGALLRVAAVVVSVGGIWMLLDQSTQHERAAERRALDQRAAELAARAMAPASPLACLNAVSGDAVESACEKAVFGSPQSVAAAVSYVSARLTLLADSADFARRNGGYEGALATLRVPIEADRYGLVAHVLSVRDSCTPLLCDSYVLLRDPDKVQANLRERLFDRYVERYASDWARAQAGSPVAEGSANFTTAASGPPVQAPTPSQPLASKYDFPSAASIPPVSIMNAEPGTTPDAKPKADAKLEAKPDANKPDPKATATAPAHRALQHPTARAPTPAAPQTRAATGPQQITPTTVGPPPSAPGSALH
jgi:hypothetical protein